MIHIIADSTSAIPQEMLSKYSNLHVIPLSLSIKGEYIPENEATIRQVIEYSEKTNQAIPYVPDNKYAIVQPLYYIVNGKHAPYH